MERARDIPPLLDPRGRSRAPVLVFGLAALGILAARLAAEFNFNFPPCALKSVTGWPCATCGGTRALRALSHFDWAGAFFLNPLLTLLVAGSAVSALLWLLAPTSTLRRIKEQVDRLPLVPLSLLAIALNWLYLILRLPH